jgi:hypothetical protein
MDMSLVVKGQESIERYGYDAWDRYRYIILNHLCTKYSPDKLKERVRELYFETDHECDTPNIHAIAEIIDEENQLIIEEFYASFNYSENDIDDIVSQYNHHISPVIDVWVEESLQVLGYPYRGSAFNSYNSEAPNMFTDKAQNILFKGFL